MPHEPSHGVRRDGISIVYAVAYAFVSDRLGERFRDGGHCLRADKPPVNLSCSEALYSLHVNVSHRHDVSGGP